MADVIRYELKDEVAVVDFDDGKANVFSLAASAGLHQALDRAEKEARALLVRGRPGLFSGGFDLSVVGGGDQAELIKMAYEGSRAALRILEFPVPTVAAVTGHAIAMGAITLCCFDLRIAADGEFKIGVNEAAIRAPFPGWARVALRARLSPTHAVRAMAHSEMFAPTEAVAAGFVDQVVPASELSEVAFSRARELSQLDSRIHAGIKHAMRPELVEEMRKAVEAAKDRLI